MRSVQSVIVTLAVSLALVAGTAVSAHAALPAATDPGGVAIRLLDAPAGSEDDPRASSYIVDALTPGTTIERHINVTNTTDATRDVRIYSGAADIIDGQFLGRADPSVSELTTWITLDTSTVSLDAGESTEVLVTLAVPDDAAGGEQYAVVWAEIRDEATSESTIAQANRVGIRIYLAVDSDNGVATDFTITDITASRSDDGEPIVSAVVTNTGTRALDVTGALTLSDGPGATSAGPFELDAKKTFLPGEALPVTFTLDKALADGPWSATISLASGIVEHELTATITFPAAGEEVVVVPDEPFPFWIILLLIGLLILIAAMVTLLLLRRRNQALKAALLETPPVA